MKPYQNTQKQSLKLVAAVLGATVFLTALGGCIRNDRPPLGFVSGTVTLDGRPLASAGLIFEPLEGGRASFGFTNVDGRYELLYIRRDKGAKVGRHKVRIYTGNPESGKPEILPACYNEETTLIVEVKSGNNTLDFRLTSAGT